MNQREVWKSTPDEPRWVETRALLASTSSCFEATPTGYVVWRKESPILLAIIGNPEPPFVREVVANIQPREIVAQRKHETLLSTALPDWTQRVAHLYTLGSPPRIEPPTHPVRTLKPEEEELLHELPEDWRVDLARDMKETKVVAAFANGEPVSFAAVGFQTETWWDLGIITKKEFRRRGFARSACLFLIQEMKETGKHPVWGAAELNEASNRLASSLGFNRNQSLLYATEKAGTPP